jgi:hypothetical protein
MGQPAQQPVLCTCLMHTTLKGRRGRAVEKALEPYSICILHHQSGQAPSILVGNARIITAPMDGNINVLTILDLVIRE